jgi:hypothetical protein
MKDLIKEIGQIVETRRTAEGKVAAEDDADAAAVREFFRTVVKSAFEEFSTAVQAHGRTATTSIGTTSASLVVKNGVQEELNYSIERKHRRAVAPVIEATDQRTGKRYRAIGFFRSGAQDYGAGNLSKDEVVAHILREYRQQMSYR